MNDKVKPSQLLATIDLPPRDQAKMPFCDSAKANAVREWVDNLQATKVMQTSGKLYTATPQVARLKTDYKNRFDILEILRPTIQYAILGLQKTFLNQPLIMPEEAQKSVVVAQALQKNMINGYVTTVVQIAEKGRANKQTFALLSQALHRAITGIGLLFFRNYQIYAQTPASLWATLNILYQVARYYELTQQAVVDPILRSTRALSIEAAYARILMMATARTNQMSQTEIDTAFWVFENWCQAVKLNSDISDDAENFFAINLTGSQGPVYKSHMGDIVPSGSIEIDFKSLLSQLSKQSTNAEDIIDTGRTVKVPKEFSETLLKHLIDTWSSVAQRKHERRHIESAADVCVGLTDSHYFVCNGQDFDYFLRSAGTHEPQKISRFSQGLPPASHSGDAQASFVPVHRVTLQNASAGGYCLLWQQDISAKVIAGEVIGVKEIGKRTWSVGVIRWVRQLKNASQLGIQLISNNPKPYGIAQTYDSGGYSEYMRAFFVPPAKFGQGKPTLMTVSAPFQEFDKVRLIDGEKEWRAKLDRAVFSTKSMQQFRFRNIDGGAQATGDAGGFDAEWN